MSCVNAALWNSRPSLLMMAFSAADLAVVSALAIFDALMRPLPAGIVVASFAATLVFALLLRQVKVALFRHLRVD